MPRSTLTAVIAAAGISLFAGAADAETIPARLMANLARDFALQDFQAAGVTGNLARETGNFRFMQELEPVVKGSRGGIGYSQWTASRRVAFEGYAGSVQRQMTYEVNYGYRKKELEEDYAEVIDDVRRSKNLWEATVIFMRGYLKPKKNPDNIRVSMNYGSAYLRGDYAGSGCQSRHQVTIDGRRMMIAACPETTIAVDGRDVGIVLARSDRPRARPAEAGWTRIADAGLSSSSRPRGRPDAPQPALAAPAEVNDAVLVAMSTPAVRIAIEQVDPLPDEDPGDRMDESLRYARKEDDPEERVTSADTGPGFGIFA